MKKAETKKMILQKVRNWGCCWYPCIAKIYEYCQSIHGWSIYIYNIQPSCVLPYIINKAAMVRMSWTSVKYSILLDISCSFNMDPKRHPHDGFKKDVLFNYMRLLVSTSACRSIIKNNARNRNHVSDRGKIVTYPSHLIFYLVLIRVAYPRSFYRHWQFLASIKDGLTTCTKDNKRRWWTQRPFISRKVRMSTSS